MKHRVVVPYWIVLAGLNLLGCGDAERDSENVASENADLSAVKTTKTPPPMAPAVPPSVVASLGIGSPNFGEALYQTSSWYDPVDETIRVTGGVSNVPAGLNLADLAVVVNNTAMWFTGNANTKTILFEGRIAVPDDPGWVHRGIVAELVHAPTGRVIARDFTTYFDLRTAADATPQADKDLVIPGLAAQLTEFGLGKRTPTDELSSLEVPHLASLPHPNLGHFNDELVEGALAALPATLDAESCMNFKELDDLVDESLIVLPAYGAAYLEAAAYYAAYEAWQEGGAKACSSIAATLAPFSFGASVLATLGCELAMAGWCVKEMPVPEDFELCVGSLEAEPTSLTIREVSDVDLGFLSSGSGATIESSLELRRVLGKLDIRLKDISVRWEGGGCSPRVEVNQDDAKVPESLDDFATCHDATVSAAKAKTGDEPAEFAVLRASDKEALDVTQVQDPLFDFVNPEVDAEKGTCALDFLADEAGKLADTFPTVLEEILNDTWNAGGARTQQAEALDLLFDRLELGVREHEDYVVQAEHQTFSSTTIRGAFFEWDTYVSPQPNTSAVTDLKPFWFHHPPPQDPYQASDALDVYSDPFDFSYLVSTGYLNQILRVRGATEDLHFEYQPTWQELAAFGVDPRRTTHPTDRPPPLDGSVLGQVHSVFRELGSTPVTVSVYPALDPVVWMHPDHPSNDPAGSPLGYGISALEIRFTSAEYVHPDTGKLVPSFEWMRALFSFADRDFHIGIGPHGSRFLEAAYQDDVWGVSVETNAFTSCTMAAHGTLEPPTPCERDLEQLLLDLFAPRLEPVFLDMLSDIEAPQFWNASGATSKPVHLDTNFKYQESQYIHLFTNIPNE